MDKNPSTSPTFKPILNDQDYMEVVCENGQILAKTRRTNNNGSLQIKRTQSLLELYETEYDESFKKRIKNLEDTQIFQRHHQDEENDEQTNNNDIKMQKKIKMDDDSLKVPTNVEVITAPPDEQSAAIGRSTELYFASSSKFSQETARDLSCCLLKKKKKYVDFEEEEESTYSSNSSDDKSEDMKTQVLARTRKTLTKRKRSTEVHKLTERKRRNEINKKMRVLQDLLPNCYKDDKASLLDEAIIYMRTLQLQVQMMSMGNGLIRPPMMLPMGYYPSMSLGMHMGVAATPSSVPQFVPMNVQGTNFLEMKNASSQMLSFPNHPTGLVPNLESCSQQFEVPSCVIPHSQSTSFTQFPKSPSTSNLEDAMIFRGNNGY